MGRTTHRGALDEVAMFGVLHPGYGSRHTRQHSGGCMPGIDNAIVHYYDRLRPDPTEGAGPTEGPSFELPDLDDRWREFFAVSSITAAPLHAPSAFDGLDVVLLDLMGNPRTRTTKTNPSLLMVARAVVHVTSTGRPLTIVTPSSANKATALRDAVLRAYECGLVSPEELNVVCLVPPSSVEKIWSSPLATHAEWARRNPVLVLDEGARSSVKQVVEALRVEHQQGADHQDDATWWFTMQLDNYTFADRLRAWFETDHLPADGRRWHSHAVSSAFGLLGHARGTPPTGPHPGYLLVQHLATPDMVLHLRTGSFDRAGLPRYDLTPTGFTQLGDPHFPAVTQSLDEVLEPTFYTHAPPTQERMQRLIEERGGDGIVVSLQECLEAYDVVRGLLRDLVPMPADPRDLREWSLSMAMTGSLLAARRGLLDDVESLVVHASGSYAVGDYVPVPAHVTATVGSAQDLADVVRATRARTSTSSSPRPTSRRRSTMTHCPISILSAVDFNDEVIPRDDLVRTAREMLDEHGYVQLVNVPDDFHYVDFASEFGDFVPNYGGPVVGDVRPEPGMEDVYHAGNTRPLTPHTEGYDFTTPPPRYLMLWCVTPASGEGGETTIGDTKPWVEALDESDREHLFSTVFHWKTTDGIARKGLDLHTEHPVLEDMGAPTPTVRFSCNNLLHEDDDVALRLQAEWQRRYADEAVWIRYHRNDVLLWDNWRVLHARNAFSDPQRHLRRLQIRPAGVLAGVQG